MIAIPDAGEIKAKVTIEYDGSGVDAAKKDLASLGDVGSGLEQSALSAGDALGMLGEQASKSAGGANELSSAFADLPKIAEQSGQAFTSFSEGAAKSQAAIDGMVTSVEEIQAPLEKTGSLLSEAAAPMSVISEHAQSMEKQLSGASESFAQIGESLAQSVPLLPQYAESMQSVMEAMQPTLRPYDVNEFARQQAAFGLDMLGGPPVAENMAVFQAALEDPTPFDMIDSHLNATGQTYGDFAASIGKDNATMLHEMNNASNGSYQVLGNMSDQVQAVGQDFHESASSAQEFADQFNGVTAAATKAKSGISGIGGLGAEEPLKAIGLGEGFGNALGGVMDVMNKVAMPIMAVQMIGMAVTGAAQGIYNMAAVAEGPGAHGVGTFTGTVDALGQSLAQTGQQFSEGFGKAVIPTLQQMNMEASQGSGSGGVGGFLGGLGSTLLNLGRIGTGMDVIGGFQGLMNQAADMAGMPLPFQGPPPETQAAVYTRQQMGMIPQNVQNATAQADVQTANVLADATNPAYLQSQDNLSAAQKLAQHLQTSYDISHPVNVAQLQSEAQYQQYAQQQQQAMASQGTYLQNGDIGGAFSDFFRSIAPGSSLMASGGPTAYPSIPGLGGAANFLSGLFGGGAPTSMLGGLLGGATFGGMFGGIGSIFSNLFGGGGTGGGLGTSMTGAGGGLGLGGNIGAQIMQSVADSGIPHTNLQGSSLLSSMASNFSSADMSHTFTATVSWVASGGLEHTFLGEAAWNAIGELMHTFLGESAWNAVGELMHTFIGESAWNAVGELLHTFVGEAAWNAVGDLLHTFIGEAAWNAVGELIHTFLGEAGWNVVGELAHTFVGIASWIGQNLAQTFVATASFIPGFASGVQNYSGGLAVVGESGPELLQLPQGASVYPMSSSSSGTELSPMLGGNNNSGGSAPQSINLVVQLDSQSLITAMGIPLSQNIRLSSGMRAF